MSGRDRTDAEKVEEIRRIVSPSQQYMQRTKTIVETTVEAIRCAQANPGLSANEIAARIGRRKPTVRLAVTAFRKAEASGHPPSTLEAPAKRVPSRGAANTDEAATAPTPDTRAQP